MRKAKILDRRVYRPGQTLFHEGDQAWAAFLIESGEVEILRSAGQRHEVLLATVGPGELIGEMGLIDNSPRSATARALGMTVVQVITEQNFSRLLTNAEPGLVALLKVLLRRLRVANETVSAQSCLVAETRLLADRFEDEEPLRPVVN
ncbi:cyclic nucleotide-binding domain-containing protein [Thalassobaculum sp. OXR-137]|uniref:cyclic nucleotide-binding domain-containing protein n=1 Tax=Thalassobaculum sp. OXR-137 TaxID=3100173 RepID=UPI002AC91DAE|nr:cyclic nucleotide-binding domain-containing protein [Thalassobaculum sp. OXR-137]WPZ35675.1 cyclic nucleotide-binding domain-containing protein [Thalassobaculum sp. OXR-137]